VLTKLFLQLLTIVFKLITQVPEKEFDFPSWCTAILGFCTLTHDELVRSMYFLHDVDKNGFLDISELTVLLENMHQENEIFPSQLTASIVQHYILEDGKMDFEEFKHACQTHPMILWPLFRIQHRMRRNLLGRKFWEKIDGRLEDIYKEDLSKKGGLPPSEFAQLKEFVDVYICTFCGCYDKDAVIQSEIEAGEKDIAFQRALGEFDPDPELVRYREELEEKRKRHIKEAKGGGPTSEDSSEAEESVSEVVIKEDDDEYGETSEHKAQLEATKGLVQEKKDKDREARRINPKYYDQDHFDSEWYDYSDEIRDLGELSVDYDEHPDSRKI